MNDSSNKQTGKRIPSDQEMDNLLQEFFVLETPSALRQPFQRPERVAFAENMPAAGPRKLRLMVISTLSILAMSLIASLKVSGPAGSGTDTTLKSPSSPVAGPTEALMFVSPNAERKASVVGEDGVTLEETDAIELKAEK